MANRIATAWGFNNDTGNNIPGLPLLEDMADSAAGGIDIQPRPTLRGRNYGTQPLIVMPEYKGDFLEKLKEQKFKNKSADSLLDFSSPEDMLKYLPEVQPRDLTDEYYEMNRPGEGAGYDDLKHYHDRGWDAEDSPEMSEDKILRMEDWNKKFPEQQTFKPTLFHTAAEKRQAAQIVLSRFLMEVCPITVPGIFHEGRIAKLLSYFEGTTITTPKGGTRSPYNGSGVNVALIKAMDRLGLWVYSTRSSTGEDTYTTSFQFIPKGSIRKVSQLDVRVSCTCPSWIFWGAQYNAVMDDYLYGPVKPKFTRPGVRDPEGRFLVCKHILACLPIVSREEIKPMVSVTKKKLMKPMEYVIDKEAPEENLHIPDSLTYVGETPEIKQAVEKWPTMSTVKRKNFIMNLKSPDSIAYMAHRFPKTSTIFVIKKLKDMRNLERNAKEKLHEEELLRGII